MTGTPSESKASKYLRLWLKHVPPCHFLRALVATDETTITLVQLSAGAGAIDAFVFNVREAANGSAIVAAFGEPASPSTICDFAATLSEVDARWLVERNPSSRHVDLRMKYVPGNGLPSTYAMGLGPFHTMPISRRAPYAAICVWPGGHQNPFHPAAASPNRPLASFADMPFGRDRKAHDKLWNSSTTETEELGLSPTELRKLTFRLPI